MILISLRSGLFFSCLCLGLGLYFLHEVFVTSGKDVLLVVFFAPVCCSIGLVLLWTTFSHQRILRQWKHYRLGQRDGFPQGN